MAVVILLLLVAAAVLAVAHAFGVGGRVNLGWLAIACVIAAVWTLPALTAF
ncbi:hypothetical protein O7626_40130 [Micromonospora sp. WMMD1102]|uniref:hypothetical protein n=1 Tax=Micromonospora sp. WMMD1102 TaxID=3016105 RepID=UPI0024152AA7|nr:hypothetical protein [Micromonospora sp. WMMD1102]MDG4792026.1 hypothetical protein [Micromonospora sp. WMMD1102]